MLKLARRARGHFVTLIEIRMRLIRVKPGHISKPLLSAYTCRQKRIMTGLYIRASSRRSSPASLSGFADYFHCLKSKDMQRR